MEIALVRKESLLERAKVSRIANEQVHRIKQADHHPSKWQHAEEKKVLQARIEELQQQVADSRTEAETLKLALGKVEAAHQTEMEIFAEVS